MSLPLLALATSLLGAGVTSFSQARSLWAISASSSSVSRRRRFGNAAMLRLSRSRRVVRPPRSVARCTPSARRWITHRWRRFSSGSSWPAMRPRSASSGALGRRPGSDQLAGLQRCGRWARRHSQLDWGKLNGKKGWSRHADSNCGPAVYELCGPDAVSDNTNRSQAHQLFELKQLVPIYPSSCRKRRSSAASQSSCRALACPYSTQVSAVNVAGLGVTPGVRASSRTGSIRSMTARLSSMQAISRLNSSRRSSAMATV